MALETTPFDPAASIETIEDVGYFLEDAFEHGDAGDIAHALGIVARSRGMTALAERSGMTRQALYKALRIEGNPEFGTIMKVMRALGFRLVPVAA